MKVTVCFLGYRAEELEGGVQQSISGFALCWGGQWGAGTWHWEPKTEATTLANQKQS